MDRVSKNRVYRSLVIVLSVLVFCSCGRGGRRGGYRSGRRSGIHNRSSMHKSRIVHGPGGVVARRIGNTNHAISNTGKHGVIVGNRFHQTSPKKR